MKYLILLYSEPHLPVLETEAEQQAEMGEWFAATQELADSGELLGGEPLQGVDTATTVSVRDGETLITDGPFAETKEILGGYYLVEVDSLARAQQIAARLPSAHYGRNEVRPLMELPEMPG